MAMLIHIEESTWMEKWSKTKKEKYKNISTA